MQRRKIPNMRIVKVFWYIYKGQNKLKRHVNISKIDQDTSYYSADLQKVIMLPRMDTLKTVMFTRRIVAFNESFVPLGGTNNDDDDNGKDTKKIVLWLDNCTAQIKNWTLLSFIAYLVNSEEVASEEIQLNYFEIGLTFMSADSFHHQVELSLKKKECV
ncbi:hypothetical protein PR048_027077 [Dryococelus australis]|uniref:DUF7869 domain-containing protein n=1 Tax=Dryococelus australis TaxID=614101 RepID=A0ABQ9GG71_9NEOP|nr:hypothetical protein PR048_027077 [Dryococelus australis]